MLQHPNDRSVEIYREKSTDVISLRCLLRKKEFLHYKSAANLSKIERRYNLANIKKEAPKWYELGIINYNLHPMLPARTWHGDLADGKEKDHNLKATVSAKVYFSRKVLLLPEGMWPQPIRLFR